MRTGPINKVFISLALLIHLAPISAQGDLPAAHSADLPPSHQAWDYLLKMHVAKDGFVDYRGLLQKKEAVADYLHMLGSHLPGKNWNREALLAYFINLYNAATVWLILEHYPLGSIREIPGPWSRKFIRIGSANYSLGYLEHQVLREMGDPRIHFAINCASVSCPELQGRAYTEEEMESQLDAATRKFIMDTGRNRISGEKASLSRIFKWYRQDFTPGNDLLIEFLNTYLPDPIPVDARIEFLPYDWSLNEPRN